MVDKFYSLEWQTNPYNEIIHFCDFSCGVLNACFRARIQHLLRDHRNGLFHCKGSVFGCPGWIKFVERRFGGESFWLLFIKIGKELSMAKSKAKTVFFCKECGYETPKWMGQCPGCHQWNTMTEEKVSPVSKGTGKRGDNPVSYTHLTLPTILRV